MAPVGPPSAYAHELTMARMQESKSNFNNLIVFYSSSCQGTATAVAILLGAMIRNRK